MVHLKKSDMFVAKGDFVNAAKESTGTCQYFGTAYSAYFALKIPLTQKISLHILRLSKSNTLSMNAVKGMSAPWHAGTEKFFKEKGVLK